MYCLFLAIIKYTSLLAKSISFDCNTPEEVCKLGQSNLRFGTLGELLKIIQLSDQSLCSKVGYFQFDFNDQISSRHGLRDESLN